MKRPAFQFYPADWRKDVELQSCSMAAQGLWINAMCVAHECEPYGHLMVNGKGMSAAQIGRQVGLGGKEAQTLIEELITAGVARRTPEGVIFSKRMTADEDLRNRRAAGGPIGAEHGIKGAKAGIKGGRPRKATGDKKPPLNPPPSSSSSSSPSGSTEASASVSATAEAAPKSRKNKIVEAATEAPTTATWNAYSNAYERRYGCEPLRNAKVNGILSKFLDLVPAEDGPEVAAFYVRHGQNLYVNAKHPVELLVRDAERLYTDWRMNSNGNAQSASGETAYQRSKRERVAEVTGNLASTKAPGQSASNTEIFNATAPLALG